MNTRPQFKEGWTSLVLLLGMSLAVAWALLAAGWTEGLWVLQSVAVISVLAGLALAKSRFPPIVAHVFSAVYGIFWIGYSAGSLIEATNWHDRIIFLAMRLATWLSKAVGGGQSRDSLMFVVVMGTMMWVLGYVAAWYTYRWGREWQAVLPIGVALLLINYYYYGPAKLYLYLILFLLCALLFIVHMHFVRRTEEWRRAHVNFNPDLWYGFLRSGVIVAALVIFIAWQSPPASASSAVASVIGRGSRPWQMVGESWSRLFSALKSYGQVSSDAYGRFLNLGGPVQLSDVPIMDVQAPQITEGRYYWRAVVYDEFNGMSWTNTDENLTYLDPSRPDLPLPYFEGRRVVTQTIMTFLPTSSLLYSAPQPLWVNRTAAIQFSLTSDGLANISSMHSRDTLRQGDVYTVVSTVTEASESELRQAGTDYPDWVTSRYLQLPDSTTQRTRDLAKAITAPFDNPYDKALAIQTWLRQNIRYNLNVDAPPDGHDAVDWVLFQKREGYCNYYASAMVVMLRTLGIPARFSAGYAQGEWNADLQVYRVRERDAHAWPEVFFPKYGWVEFEPTVSQDPIQRPTTPSSAQSGNSNRPDRGDNTPLGPNSELNQLQRNGKGPEEGTGFEDTSGGFLGSAPTRARVGVGLLALVLAGAAGAVVFWSTEWRGLGGLSIVSRSYARLLRYARWLGIRLGEHQTPHERARVLAEVVPEGREPITRITDLYVQERFGRGSASPEAETLWRRLRPTLLLGGIRRALSRLQDQNLPDRWIRLRR